MQVIDSVNNKFFLTLVRLDRKLLILLAMFLFLYNKT